ncbi:MAG TPA: VanW family protein [Armatimonadota bacterium]|jgi:vancomycin resistance protein YoaR
MRILKLAVGILLLLGVSAALSLPSREEVLGGFATSLTARTRGQRENATRAAQALDGAVIPPGGELSFNRAVGPWTADRGYVRAPVSYEGELIVDWGGGVCQTSTTLYNAALLAGLEVTARSRHSWAPRYVPPGRDAAVAQASVDLRLRNPYPWPVRLHASASEDTLSFEVLGRLAGPVAEVQAEQERTYPPDQLVQADPDAPAGSTHLQVRGRPGAQVAVYRRFRQGPRAGQRELISRDYYPPLTRVVRRGTAGEEE